MNINIVDAFTYKPFTGNPAAVCVLERDIDDDLKQQIAMEMNLSETAFVVIEKDGFNLRWFTPRTEVELCGHATLASAHILWEEEIVKSHETIKFLTRSGLLEVSRGNDLINMNFPPEPVNRVNDADEVHKCIDVNILYAGKNRFDYMLEIESEDNLKSLVPDLDAISRLDCRGLIVTCGSVSDEWDFTSRFFAPKVGINEDPVTGSAHCALGPYWSRKLRKNELAGFQASQRGGMVYVKITDEKVVLSGKAITVMQGNLLV